MTDAAQWGKELRSSIKKLVGFTVTNDRGRVRLQYRRSGLPTESIALPYRWANDDWSDVAIRVRAIAKAMQNGQSLSDAGGGVDSASSNHEADWPAALAAYRKGPQKRLSEVTWNDKHLRVISLALAKLEGRQPPTNGTKLMEVVLRQWDDAPTQHGHMRRGLAKFLTYCVEKRHFNACWLPGEIDKPPTNEKRIGYPLTDAQILRLIDSMPETTIGRRYRFAFQLMATYGLRPADLKFLHTRNGGTELWSEYRKSKGGSKGARTEPRRLYALAVQDADGTPHNWNLVQRVHLGEELPPLGELRETGQRLHIYLKDKPVWHSIKAEAEAERQQATAYSFRHRYAYTAHNRPMASGQMRSPKQCADAIGHSLDVHLKNYARFQTRDLASAFDEEPAVAAVAGAVG